MNSGLINNKCTILVPTSNAVKFLGRLDIDKSIKFNANPFDLLHSIQIKTSSNIPTLPSLTIQASQIPSIFLDSPAFNTLQTIAHHNYSSTNLTFYTDGSVINTNTIQCSMGIGWLQLDNNNINHTFNAQISLWPCSFKAELLAILSAICTAPRNCNIEIFTDSQSVISKYHNLLQHTTNPNPSHTAYWSIWNTLLNLIKSYNLKITFHKVKAHQNNELNNKADQLAHNHPNAPHLIFNFYNIYNPLYTLTSNGYPLELPACYSIKLINHANIYALWTTHNRFQPWLLLSEYIHWDATWLYLNNNQKVSNFAHSFQSSTLKTFRINLLADELPAPHILHKRNPHYFNLCHNCQQTSSTLHWAICPNSNLLNNLIHNSIQSILTPSKLQASTNIANQLHTQIINLDSLQIHYLPDKPSIFSTLSGLVPLDIINTIREFTTSNQIATSLSIQVLLHLNKQLYTNIWILYYSSRPQPQLIHTSPSILVNNTSTANMQNNITQILSSKVSAWYTNWIKYHIHPLYIFTLPQI